MEREQWRIVLQYAIEQISSILSDEKPDQAALDDVFEYVFKFVPEIEDYPDAKQHFKDRIMAAANEKLLGIYSTDREVQHLGGTD